VCNGIISADLTPHPAINEVKYAYQYVRFEEVQDGYEIHNFHDFTDLSDYEIGWTVSGNGENLYSGVLENFNIESHSNRIINPPYPNFTPKPGVEYFIDFSVQLKKDKPFRPDGFEVAHDQFQLEMYVPDKKEAPEYDALKLTETGNMLEVSGINFIIQFEKGAGTLASYKINGMELLQKGPQVSFWRPPNDNDKGSNMIGRLGIWREVTNEAKPALVESAQLAPGKVVITAHFKHEKVNSEQTVSYTITGDGAIAVNTRLTINEEKLPDLPRIGMKWELPVNFDNLEYFGRGPHENYVDRNRSAFVANYSGKVADQYFKYVRPQENGYKTDVRWFELRNENGVGIRVSGEPLVSFSALHNPIEDFDMIDGDDYRHTNDIVKKDGVFVNCDLKMMGVAGDNSWGARPYPQYSAPAKDYEFGFTIHPVF
jgi:beta-galactosidase